MIITFEVQGEEVLMLKLNLLTSPQATSAMLSAAGLFLRDKLRDYPPYIYVSRRQAYGQSFQSERQRRWFFAALARGEITIPYPRTYRLREGWQYIPRSPIEAWVRNEVPYVGWVQGPQQARMMQMRGWPRADRLIAMNAGALHQVIIQAYRRTALS